ncbi:MAG: bifunctional 2-polyprenyl-6-hydroxyphenol methylase/3-demethylubiquinol 3-O-methyltransferase UbiG [Gammaproteobacteria bacterium]
MNSLTSSDTSHSSALDENVDYQEIAKFENLASRWWDPNSEFKPLHDINPLRLDYIDQRVGLAGKRVLDIGCGGGILAESMVQRGAQVVAIDMAEASLAVARLHQRESAVEVDYRHCSAEELAAAEAASFDIVTCLEMLEHVPDPAAVVTACQQLLKPGGQAFFSTINRNSKSYVFAIIGAEYLLRLLPKGTHDWHRFIKPSELDRWARSTGLELQDLTGMHYNPLTRRYWLASGVDVNYLAHYRMAD